MQQGQRKEEGEGNGQHNPYNICESRGSDMQKPLMLQVCLHTLHKFQQSVLSTVLLSVKNALWIICLALNDATYDVQQVKIQMQHNF